jgi:diaminohydroxyphosphoribosylaminopyrimidine deaminase / 5-amino-6-(5-phosphoribosylamino)uracil reductase
MATANDATFMQRALSLARQGAPAPNPHVGAVVVRHERVVGEGHHERAGGAHAEVVALERAGELARGATLYVTLEPCNHQGRTPPCVDALLRSGIARVVIGCADPNPFVSGGGAEGLRRAGIQVEYGPCNAEALDLIEPWRATLATGSRGAQEVKPAAARELKPVVSRERFEVPHSGEYTYE